MKYSGIIYNDFSAAPGVSLTFFTQGCPHRCSGCHNPETWDFNGGQDFSEDIVQNILEGLIANNIKRNFCIMGGEPLCPENVELTLELIQKVKQKYNWCKIYVWTGYTYEELNLPKQKEILDLIDVLIDGPFIEELKDLTLPMRGSYNQRIIHLTF